MATQQDFQLSKKKTRDNADLDITPMIDITFLLLAFFVMVSKMSPQLPVDLPQAKYGDTIPEKNCVVLVVVAGDSNEDFKIFKGNSTDPADLVAPGEDADMEAEIGEFVESEFSKRPSLEAVLIKGEGEVTTGAIDIAQRGAGKSDLALERKLFIGVAEN